MKSTTEILHQGADLHRQGRLAEAEPIYRRVLREEPSNANALYLLGTVHFQRGEWGSASLFLRKALAADPRHPEARNNLSLVLQEQGKFEEAAAELKRVIALDPRHADAHFNLGIVHRRLGRIDQAEVALRRAIELAPGWAEAHDQLGLVLRERDRPNDAIGSFDRAIERKPTLASAHNNRGAALRDLGRYAEAAEAFQEASRLEPTSAVARSNRAMALAHLGELESAEIECKQALELDPMSAVAWNNLGLILFLAGREGESAAPFARACELSPKFADAHNNLASAYFRVGQIDEALRHYQTAVEIKPTTVAYKNLGSILEHACEWPAARAAFAKASGLCGTDPLIELRRRCVCPTVFESSEQINDYRRDLEQSLDRLIESPVRRTPAELYDLDLRPSFAWQFHGRCDRSIRTKLAEVVEQSIDPMPAPTRPSGIPTAGFLVVAGHEFAFLRSIGGLFPLFRRDLWRPIILCASSSVEKIRREPGLAEADCVVIPKELVAANNAVRSLSLDVLYHFEIGTGPLNYLLPFLRPARRQVTSWGIQVTSGINALSHYLSSHLIEVPEADEHYSERLVRLDTLLSYQRYPSVDGPLPTREELGLPTGANLYLCPQQIGKFHPDFDATIERILDADPSGALVVTESSQVAEKNALRARWSRTLAGVQSRIHFTPKQAGERYLGLIQAADVLLDPPHFGGVNTTYDALGLGKVVITKPSTFHRGRYTQACYRAMDLTHPVADSVDDYVRKAVALATSGDARRHWEEQIRERRCALFEVNASARELEEWMLETIHADRAH